jgi:hypothetical protein
MRIEGQVSLLILTFFLKHGRKYSRSQNSSKAISHGLNSSAWNVADLDFFG